MPRDRARDAAPGRRRGALVPLGSVIAPDLRAVFDPARGRVNVSRVASEGAAAEWIGGAELARGGDLEVGPRLAEHIAARSISMAVARRALLEALDRRGLRGPIVDRDIKPPNIPATAAPPTAAPLRVVRWCEHCRSQTHDPDAHVDAVAAARTARAHLDAGDDDGARAWATHARALLSRPQRRSR